MTSHRNREKKLKCYDPIVFNTLFRVHTCLVKLLCFTYRLVRIEGLDLERDALERSGGKAVYCSWHQRLFYHPYYLSNIVIGPIVGALFTVVWDLWGAADEEAR